MSKAERLAKLEELKRLRQTGESRIKTYNPEEQESLYDVVDAEDYKSRYDDDDEFIEVNNGDHSYNRNEGYNDIGGRYGNGYSDDDGERDAEYDSDGNRYSRSGKGNRSAAAAKRKRGSSKKDSAVTVDEPSQPKVRSKDIAEMLRQAQKPKKVCLYCSFISVYIILITNFCFHLETHYCCW